MGKDWELEKASIADQGEAGVSLADLAELTSEGLALVDPITGITVISNGCFQQFFGLAPGEEVAFLDLLVQDWAREGWSSILQVGSGQSWRPARILMRTARRKIIPAEVRIAWVERTSGPILGVAIKDLSQEERLSTAVARGVRLRRLSMITGSLVHQFNNLLATMVGFAASFRTTNPAVAGDPSLARIEEAGFEATQLAGSLARYVSPPEKSRSETLSAAEEIRSLGSLLGKLAEKRKCSLDFAITDDCSIHLRGDLFRDLLLDVSLRYLSACPRGGTLGISLAANEPGVGGQWAQGQVVVRWEIDGEIKSHSPGEGRNPLIVTQFLAASLGGDLDLPEWPNGPAELRLPRAK